MTRLDPSLKVSRLVLQSNGSVIYDEKFKNGVNIIRSSENSCGKSTIMDFIYYGFGGEISDWRAAAKQVDTVFMEAIVNGNAFTLKREVQADSKPGVYVYDGHLESALQDSISWIKYGNRRTEDLKSFSQVIFELLGFPEQKTKQDNNVTFTQILRLIYCDQETPVNKIYKDVKFFDQESMRKSIIELLLGVDDFELHSMRAQLAELRTKSDTLNGSVKSLKETLFKVYGFTNLAADQFDREIGDLEKQIQDTQGEIDSLIANETTVRQRSRQKDLRELGLKAATLRSNLSMIREKRTKIIFELEDSARFIESLIDRSNALEAAMVIKDFFGSLDFKFCPICLAELRLTPSDHTCGLCKSSIDAGSRSFNRLKAKSEIDFQLKESQELLTVRQSNRFEIDQEIEKAEKELQRQERHLSAMLKLPSYADQEIFEKMNKIGYIERQIEDIVKNKHLGQLLYSKIEEQGALEGQIKSLESEIGLLEEGRSERWEVLTKDLKNNLKGILSSDTGVEEAFQNPGDIEVLFEKNRVIVDSISKFSASSAVILKNALYLSLLELSLKDRSVRFPRLLMLDNIEDKGMTASRSHNFQKAIVSLSESTTVEHQIIFTTSMISPDLDSNEYCVGRLYTPQNKSLELTE